MTRLLRFEFRKLFRHKMFYICLIISAALIAATAYTEKTFGSMMDMGDAFTWTDILDSFYSNAMLTILLGIFTALFVSEDAAGGTLKNLYSKGYSRAQVYFSKYIVDSIGVLIFCAVDILASILIPQLFGFTAGETSSMFVPDICGTVILLLVLNTLYFFISVLLGKSGLGIALNIIVPNMVAILLPAADMLLKLEKFSLNDYWISDLLYAANTAATSHDLGKAIGLGLLWILVLHIAGVLINSRQEV